MHRLFPAVVALLLLVALQPASAAASSTYQAWLDEAFAADGPGATVILTRDGEVVFRGAAGRANLELGVPMQPDHVLRIGSLTKQFTAAAILLLRDRGRLALSDEVARHLPDFPPHGARITIAQLLAHTSGLFNYTDQPGYWRGQLLRTDVSVQQIIGMFADKPPQFAPGSRFSYSNSGYALLGAIIERVSGKPYAEFLRSEIFAPLGLVDTQYGGLQLVLRRASGYQIDADKRYRNALPLSMTHAYAAGALLSTVDDLARWNAALFGGRLLSDESLRLMTTATRLADGSVTEYGFGLYVRERDGLRVIGHSGGIHGFTSSAWWLPEQRLYAAVLTNLEDSGKANELLWRLLRDAATDSSGTRKKIPETPPRHTTR
ncbi:serine hydrolase domain-containing protein [Piscinibacter sakaiensis]|uniref:serine hydrolase domain-containing protein n=1 Tax=Piscinibacter sakaiensis TaxID=1547922 RepID=UPI003AAD5685